MINLYNINGFICVVFKCEISLKLIEIFASHKINFGFSLKLAGFKTKD
jgi:hypothetical protein